MECKCVTCIRKDCPERTNQDDLDFIVGCDDYLDHEPTNADRIRAMSDEELAKWLCGISTAECCDRSCPARDMCDIGDNGMIKWLKQPAEVEHD